MEEYFFAIATGALAAMSLALWLRLKSLSKQQEEIFELFNETLSKGVRVDVHLDLAGDSARWVPKRPGGPKKSPRDVSRHSMLRSVSSARSYQLPKYSILEEVKIVIAGHEIQEGEVLYCLLLKSKKGASQARRKASSLQILCREISQTWESEKTMSMGAYQPLPAAPVNFVSDPGDESGIEKTKAMLEQYFGALPIEILSHPVVQHFFVSEIEIEEAEETGPLSMSLEEETGVPDGLTATTVKTDSPVQYIEGWCYLDTAKKRASLSQGKTFFTFACHSGTTLSERELIHVDSIVNLSSFDDELKDNNVPFLDMKDPEIAAQFTVTIVKNSYILPDLKLEDFTPELLCSSEYLHGCMPGPPKIWKEVPDNTTFRITKTIIPWVYYMTFQFKCTVLAEHKLPGLTRIDNCPVHKAILLERTKRDKSVQDATRKAKSILLYTEIEGGVLFRNVTVALNTWIPNFAVPFIDNLGSLGAKETKDTAVMTRKFYKKYLKKKEK